MDKRGKGVGSYRQYRGRRVQPSQSLTPEQVIQQRNPTVDLKRKIQLCAWHPKENTYAVARNNLLFIYSEKKCQPTAIIPYPSS
jgi:hypothetical protein